MAKNNQIKFKETEIGPIPEEWAVLNFSAICVLQRGFDLPKDNRIKGDYPLVASNGISEFISEYKVNGPGVTTGRSGTLGQSFFIKENFWPLNTALWVKDFKGNNPYYIYLLLGQLNLADFNAGSGVPTLNRNHLDLIRIGLPPIEEQKRIAEILGALDKKIELNRRMNDTLEKIASAIFKHWFVDYASPAVASAKGGVSQIEFIDSELGKLPEGWRVQKLSDIANITIGRTPPRLEKQWFSVNPADIKWISIRDLGNEGIYINNTAEYLTREAVSKFNIPLIPKDTVIVSFKLTIGRVAITAEEMLSNEAIAHIKTSDNNIIPEFIFLYLKRFDYSILGSTSSIATATNSQAIKQIPIIIPPQKISDRFKSEITPIFKEIKINETEIKNLSQIRDSLLPRLMSGKIRV